MQAHDRIIINPDGVGCPRMTLGLEPLVQENPFGSFSNEATNRASSPGSLRRSHDRRAALDLRKAREEWDSKTKENVPKPRSKSTDITTLTEDQLILCSPEIQCFDLLNKVWTSVGVNQVGDVAWNENAFDDLIWPTEEKDLLLAIAESHSQSGASTINHILDRKSPGTTIMLNGPSGCGKKSAAEAIAEKLHMPLYSVSVGEAIREFSKFEAHLEEALERCAKWNAILLFKDIDFFFEKTLAGTDTADTCATVSHHLQCHPGLVFLTSTSPDLACLEPMLKRQFDLTLKIKEPSREMRRQIWANVLSAAVPLREQHFTFEDLDSLAERSVSGAEIKGVVKMACMLAKSKGTSLKMEHLKGVLKIQGMDKEEKEKAVGNNAKAKGGASKSAPLEEVEEAKSEAEGKSDVWAGWGRSKDKA